MMALFAWIDNLPDWLFMAFLLAGALAMFVIKWRITR